MEKAMVEWVRVGRGAEYWLEAAGYRAIVGEVADSCWVWTIAGPPAPSGTPRKALQGQAETRREAQLAVIQALYGCGLTPRDLGSATVLD